MNLTKGMNAADYRNVSLLDSPFKRQLEITQATYLAIDNDRLLHPFRQRAGKPAPSIPLAGWYGRQAFNFGQFVGALSKMYAQSGDARLRDKVLYLVEQWAVCIDADGYGFAPEKTRYKEYIIAYEYEKLCGGLCDAYEYAGCGSAMDYLDRITGWISGHLPAEERSMLYQVEWYTIPENAFRAYRLTGNQRFLRLAETFLYGEFWDRFLQLPATVPNHRHAYSHVNSFSGAAMAYEVTGEEKYLTILKNAYEEITERHIYSTGGYGPAEDMFGKPGYLGDSLKSAWDPSLTDALIRPRHDAQGSCEVSCCSWAALKLCRYLSSFTKEARYGGWAEKVLYNGVLALPPVTANGKVMYYANYYLDGGIKHTLDRRYHGAVEAYDDLQVTFHYSWQCCTGTYPQVTAEYANALYYTDGDQVYVNQYIPSILRHSADGKEFTLECSTEYPEESRIIFRFGCDAPVETALHLRVPAWVPGEMQAYVNGSPIATKGKPNEWLTIKRLWGPDDVVSLDMPLPLYFESIDENNSDIASLLRGPLVMATDDLTALEGDFERPEDWVLPVEGKRNALHTAQGYIPGLYPFETREFTPFYRYPQHQWYFLYFWKK